MHIKDGFNYSTFFLKAGPVVQVVNALTDLEIHSHSCCIYAPFVSVLPMKISQEMFNFPPCNCVFSFPQLSQTGSQQRTGQQTAEAELKQQAACFGKNNALKIPCKLGTKRAICLFTFKKLQIFWTDELPHTTAEQPGPTWRKQV